jgi:hypothetical protein
MHFNIFFEKNALKCQVKTLKITGCVKSEYLGSDPELDPELFSSQVGSGSKTQRKLGSGSG